MRLELGSFTIDEVALGDTTCLEGRRLRISVHGYNDEADVAKAIDALRGAAL